MQRISVRRRISWILHRYNANKLIFRYQLTKISHIVSDHTMVQYFVNVPNVSVYSNSEIEDIQDTIATLLLANFDDVIVSGVRSGCVIITFMIRNYLIPHLRALYTSKEKILFQKMREHKIFKVMIQNDVLYKEGIFSRSISTNEVLIIKKNYWY